MKGTSDAIAAAFATFFIFGSAFGILYVYLQSRHRERMSIIERGLSQSQFRNELFFLNSLKWGMMLLGISLGVWVGYQRVLEGMNAFVAYSVFIPMAGGISLILFYLLTRILKINK